MVDAALKNALTLLVSKSDQILPDVDDHIVALIMDLGKQLDSRHTMDITDSICNYLNITSEKYIQPLGATKQLMDNFEMELKQLMEVKFSPAELNFIL